MASAPSSTGVDPWPLASATLARAAQLAPPSLRVVNGKLGVQYSARTGQFEQYTWLMKVTDTGADQDRGLYAACIVRGCTKVPQQTLLAKYPQTSFDMGNMMKHFKSAHFDLLHPDDQKSRVPVTASASAHVAFKMPDEIAQQEEQALLLLGVGYPIAFVDSLPWITFCKNHGLKHWTRKTITRAIGDLQEKLVVEPVRSFVEYVRKPVFHVVNKVRLQFTRKVFVGNDGWTDRRGRALESFVCCTGKVVDGFLSPKRQLRPFALPVALRHWQIDSSEGDTYNAAGHAVFTADVLRSLPGGGLPPVLLLVAVRDTTYGQPKMTEAPALAAGGIANLEVDIARDHHPLPKRAGVGYGPCGQHVDSLLGRDLEHVPLFSDTLAAERAVTAFIRGSDVRVTQLVTALAKLKLPSLMPLLYPETRFLYALIAMRRTVTLFPAYKKMLEDKAFGDSTVVPAALDFENLVTTLEALLPQLSAIVLLVEPLLKWSVSAGSVRQYTTSLTQVTFQRLLKHTDAFAATGPGKAIAPVVERFRASLYERLASVQSIELARTEGSLPRSFEFFTQQSWNHYKQGALFPRKTAADDRNNAAAYLDPAVAPYWLEMGGSTKDAVSFYVRLLKGCLVQEGDGADVVFVANPADEGGVVDTADVPQPPPPKKQKSSEDKEALKAKMASLKAEYQAAVALIRAEKKPALANAEEWETDQHAKLVAAKKEFQQRGANIDDDVAIQAAEFAVQGTMMDLEDWLTDAINNEVTDFKVLRQTWKDGVFGDPLDLTVDVKARYEFWPDNSAKLPLLNFCAELLLGGMGASTENERFHSVTGYIMNKLRARMKVETLEGLALSKHAILAKLKSEAARVQTIDSMMELADSVMESFGVQE